MSKSYKKIFWGLIFATFHINIGRLEIVPTFIGFLMIVIGVNELNAERNYAALKNSKIFGKVLVCTSFITFISTLFSQQLLRNQIMSIFWITGISICEILMIYNLLLGSSKLLEDYNALEDAEEFKAYIPKYIILDTVAVVLINLALVIVNDGIALIGGVLASGVRIWMIILINRLRKIF